MLFEKVCCWSNEVITQSKPHEHVEKIYTTKLPNFFSSPPHNQLIQLSVMRNFSFIFFICLSWKALSSGARGTVCQHSNGPLCPYNLMSVLAGPCNPVHLCGLLMLKLKLHFFVFIRILLINTISEGEMKYGGSTPNRKRAQLFGKFLDCCEQPTVVHLFFTLRSSCYHHYHFLCLCTAGLCPVQKNLYYLGVEDHI